MLPQSPVTCPLCRAGAARRIGSTPAIMLVAIKCELSALVAAPETMTASPGLRSETLIFGTLFDHLGHVASASPHTARASGTCASASAFGPTRPPACAGLSAFSGSSRAVLSLPVVCGLGCACAISAAAARSTALRRTIARVQKHGQPYRHIGRKLANRRFVAQGDFDWLVVTGVLDRDTFSVRSDRRHRSSDGSERTGVDLLSGDRRSILALVSDDAQLIARQYIG